MMYPHPCPLHIPILNILDIPKIRIIVCFLGLMNKLSIDDNNESLMR